MNELYLLIDYLELLLTRSRSADESLLVKAGALKNVVT